MLMCENTMLSCDKYESIDDTEPEQSLSPVEDMEINCVFCGILFHSMEGIETHIAEVHEDNNQSINEKKIEEPKAKITVKNESFYSTPVQIKRFYSMPMQTSEKLTIFDADMKPVNFNQIKLDQVKLCMRCNRHFIDEECLSLHQFKEHAIRKRKRSTHPNCVEGIVVTLDGNWGCDICSRVFATLKQAKVHKFKSHIEPAQKQEILSNEFSRRNVNGEEHSTAIQQYRQIQPNEHLSPKLPLPAFHVSSSPKNITPVASPALTNEIDRKVSHVAIDLSQSPSPSIVNNMTPQPTWKVNFLPDSQDTKVSLSKIIQEALTSKEETNQKNCAFFAYNSVTSQYACSHCPATFSSRAVYSRHILVHRRGKAFVCDSCGMAFTRNHTLKQHKDSKCVIDNPVVGTNCHFVDQCPKCGLYFASSNSHLSHCRKICKIQFGNSVEDSTKDSIKSEETNAQFDGPLEIDMEESDNVATSLLICDFINNPSFVTKGINEFNCNLCSCYFPSFKSIGHHLEQYHRVEVKKPIVEQIKEDVRRAETIDESVKKSSPVNIEVKREPGYWTTTNNNISTNNIASLSPPPKMLHPNSFALIPMMGMTSSNEILNLSTNRNQFSIRHATFTPLQYKPRSSRKIKIQPNANGEFECTECNKAFGCRSSLSNHIKSHFNLRNKPFSCTKCGQGFMSHVSFEEHVKSHCLNVHGTTSCQGNMMASPSNGIYSMAGSSPTTGRSTCCMHCNANFSDRSLLEDHAAREHSNENGEVQCIRCSRSFSTYMAFRVHMTKAHGGPNGTPLKNSLNMSQSLPFIAPYSAMSHSLMPSPLPIYKCSNCNQDFNSPLSYDHHKTICVAPIPISIESLVSNNQFVSQ